MQGWIKLHRKIEDHWIWDDPVKFKWWIQILLTVNHADSKVNIGMMMFECKKGQSIRSLSGWAKKFQTSKDTTRNFLRLLENDGMITHENLKKTTRLTVCNYDIYQGKLHDKQTQSKHNPNAIQTQALHEQECFNNDISLKNEKEGRESDISSPPTPSDSFLIKNGISNPDAFKFLNDDSWFNQKANLRKVSSDRLKKHAERFLIEIRDNDKIIGKPLSDFHTHFMDWEKKHPISKY